MIVKVLFRVKSVTASFIQAARRFLFASLIAAWASSGWAFVERLEIEPPDPSPGQFVFIHIYGYFPSTCWTLLGARTRYPGGDLSPRIEIISEVHGGDCLAIPTSYYLKTGIGSIQTEDKIVTVSDAQSSKTRRVSPRPSEGGYFLRGDSNSDGTVELADAVHTLLVLFRGEGELLCKDAADANDDGVVDLADAVSTLEHLFLGSVEIPLPGPRVCGFDPTQDFLACRSMDPCPFPAPEIFYVYSTGILCIVAPCPYYVAEKYSSQEEFCFLDLTPLRLIPEEYWPVFRELEEGRWKVAGNLIPGTPYGGCTTLVVRELLERVEPVAR